MHWIFLLGIVGFAIFHEGFRKVVFWVCGISAALVFAILFVMGIMAHPLNT